MRDISRRRSAGERRRFPARATSLLNASLNLPQTLEQLAHLRTPCSATSARCTAAPRTSASSSCRRRTSAGRAPQPQPQPRIPEPISERSRGQVERIDHAARHLLRLIEEIPRLSRVEAAGKGGRRVPEGLRQVAYEAGEFVRPLAAKRGLPLRLRRQPGPVVARTDSGKVRHVLVSLLLNGVMFTERGQIGLRLESDIADWLPRVEDTGIGIPEYLLPKIFEPFWQAKGSDTREVDGAGLGLAISQRLAQLPGGELDVRSSVGVGSTFTLRLPPDAQPSGP